jgi:hypothetical protein
MKPIGLLSNEPLLNGIRSDQDIYQSVLHSCLLIRYDRFEMCVKANRWYTPFPITIFCIPRCTKQTLFAYYAYHFITVDTTTNHRPRTLLQAVDMISQVPAQSFHSRKRMICTILTHTYTQMHAFRWREAPTLPQTLIYPACSTISLMTLPSLT